MGSTAGKGKVPRVSRAGALGRDKKMNLQPTRENKWQNLHRKGKRNMFRIIT